MIALTSNPTKGIRRGFAVRLAALSACAALGLMSGSARADIPGFTQGGVGGTDFTLNGNPAAVTAGLPSITGGVLRSTSNVGNLATSAFFNTPQDVTNFTVSFLYDINPPAAGNPADGIALVLQNSPSGQTALGAAGGGLGYLGINNSVAIGLDIWGNNTANTRTGIAHNGNGFAYADTNP